MIERDVVVPLPDGSAEAVFLRPDGAGPFPGVLVITDVGGVRPSQRALARTIAARGCAVLLPNVFHRAGKPPFLNIPFVFNEEARRRIAELTTPLTPDVVAREAGAFLDFLAAQDGVRGPLGAVGFCFGGTYALRAAAARPEKVAAAASFHGGRLFADGPASPHLVLPRVKAALYFGHAGQDATMPAEAIAGLEAALKAWGGRFESELYAGARHGWTVPDSAAYDAAQAGRAFEKLFALLDTALRG